MPLSPAHATRLLPGVSLHISQSCSDDHAIDSTDAFNLNKY